MSVSVAPPSQIHTAGVLPSARQLRAALRVNASFSLLSGFAMAAAGWFIARPWGLGPRWLVPAAGLGVLGFAVMVARVAVQRVPALRAWSAAVIVADLGWVAGSVAVLLLARPHAAGAIAVAAVAAVVGLIAAAQAVGLARMRAGDPLADMEIIEASHELAAQPDRVWPLLTDHDLYGRLAPNLTKVEVISAPGQTLRRRCTSGSGQGWEETCTLWDEGHRFAVEVDTSDYPYPLAEMHGLWQVDPGPAGSSATMRFGFRAKPTVAGGLFALAAGPVFKMVLNRIFKGWQSELTRRPLPGRTASAGRSS